MQDNRNSKSSQEPNSSKTTSNSYVYPVRSLLEGKILPSAGKSNPRPRPLPASRSSDDLHISKRGPKSHLTEFELVSGDNATSSPAVGGFSTNTPPESAQVDAAASPPEGKTKKRRRAASTSGIPSVDFPITAGEKEPTLKVKPKKSSKTKEKVEPNFRHFPAGENPYFSHSFIRAKGASTSSVTQSQADMEFVSTAMSADHVLGMRAVPSQSDSTPLPLAVGEALRLTSPTLLPSPPIVNQPSRSWNETPPADLDHEISGASLGPSLRSYFNHGKQSSSIDAQPRSDAQTTPIFSLEGRKDTQRGSALPFNLSEYGLVHLPPLPPSAPSSERAPSVTSSAQGSNANSSLSRPRPGSSLAALVAPGAASSSVSRATPDSRASRPSSSSEVNSTPVSEARFKGVTSPSNNATSLSEPQSSGGDTHSSLESEENHVTFRFQYRQTDEGHHVVVGREGKLERCDDEPIRTPGAVQGFGVLIAVDELEDTLVVRQVSENSTDLLGLPPKYLFGLECFTDALPDDQAGILWDNIQFLSEPGVRPDGDEGGPHVFLLRGFGAPGSAIPNEGEAEDGKRVWTCWCAVHRAEAYCSTESVSSGLIVMEFELERDPHNPLYPPVPTQQFEVASPSSSMAESTEGSETTLKPGSVGSSAASDTTTPGASTAGSTPSLLMDLRDSSTTPSSSLPASLHGLDGEEDWMPSAEEVLESTTSYSKPLPALERLRRMTRGPPGGAPASSPGPSGRRSGRRSRGNTSAVGMMDVFAVMSQINEQLGAAPNLDMFLKVVVGVIKDLTQFHRVLVYQFDELWNGQVVSELLDWKQTHDLFRGLYFPAGDIPAQARELYKINKVRLLYDRGQQTARIVVRNKDDLATPLDMTHCYLRAMSPIHVKYLGNMGVRASMSISIMAFGQLWGLVMCHSYGDHGMRVSFPVRQMLRLLSQSISRNIERLSYAQRLHTKKLINTMPSEHHPTGYIVSNADDLLGLFDADYGILVIGEGAKILGPNQHGQEILIMSEYLRMKQFTTIQASNAVISDFRDLSLNTGLEVIAGLLYVPLSREGKDFIALLRKGQRKKVNWAGKPYKDGQEQHTLEPRRSFKIWSESVAGRCRTWTDEQLETAGVLALVYGKFIEVWREKENALQTTQLTNILLSNASHEVRTPLNHIINYLEMAMNGPLDLETRDNLSRSHAASKSLLFTINDLLDLTRLESGNEIALNETFNLHMAIEDACRLYKREAERRNLTFTLDLSDSPTTVIGDSKKIGTIVQNLTANALKYTDKGSITVSCTTFGEPEGLRSHNQVVVELLIADTGCGIIEEKLEKMFRQFEQVESSEPKSNAEAGVGLGLAVVGRIVGQLGGQLRVASTLNEGSQFTLLIPLTLSNEPALSMSSQSSGSLSFKSLSSRPASAGEKEIDHLVQALSTSHMSSGSQKSIHSPTISTVESDARSPPVGVFEVTGSQFVGHPVKIDDLQVAQPKSSPRQSPKQSPKDTPPKATGPATSPKGPKKPLKAKQLAEVTSSPGKLRILIVEDNEINQMIMAKRLTLDGHTIVNTTNGQEAVDKVIEDRAFDLILMDIQMPILNGFEATEVIRKVEKEQPQTVLRISHALNGRIPIIAFSASLRERQWEQIAGHGLDGWILKPIDFKRLRIIMKGITDAVQREKDVYVPGTSSWEAGGWLTRITA